MLPIAVVSRSAQAAVAVEPAPATADAGQHGDALLARLGALAAEDGPPEDRLEPALRAMVEETRAAAGALCLFDARQEVLRLAAEVGLSDEGCRQLRGVRPSGVGGWEIPLLGLRNRRAYLIEPAAGGAQVPPLLDGGTMRSVACVPLYAGPTPLGALVLVTAAPHAMTESDLHALERPLRALGAMIEAARRRSAPEAPFAPNPAAVDTVPTDRVQLLIASLAATERERARLDVALAAATEERAGLMRAEAALHARLAERGLEVERLRGRAAEAEAALANERERRAEAERRLDEVGAELEASVERERALQETESRLASELIASRRRDGPPDPSAADSVAGPPAEPVSLAAAAAPGPTGAIAVLDVDPAWRALEGIALVEPPRAAADLATSRASFVLANLAARGAIEAVAALRAAACRLPCRGCLAAVDAGAVPLAAVDVVPRAVDAAGLVTVIERLGTRGSRIVTAGGDVDVLMAVRGMLAARGMSVSMAWDAHQVADLLAMMAPDVAVLDLALPPREAQAIVSRLAAAERVPNLVLILGEGDAAAPFVGALGVRAVSARAVAFADVVARSPGIPAPPGA